MLCIIFVKRIRADIEIPGCERIINVSSVPMKGSFGHPTLPALARKSGPLHGPSPLASFGMKGSFGHPTLPALARKSGPLHGPSPLASFGNKYTCIV